MADDDGFLSRWSRRKAQVRRGEAVAEAPAVAPPAPPVVRSVPPPPVAVPAELPAATPPPPTLEDVALLTRDSDYARFVARGVDTDVKNAALKKLFSDPHFNVMDGLDVYIDDYGKPDPIPMAMLRQMTQTRLLGLFADDEDAKKAPAEALAAPAPIPEPLLAPPPHENPDLRLQPHDVAGRPEPDPGAGEDAGRAA